MDKKNRLLIILLSFCFIVFAIVIYFVLTDDNGNEKESIKDVDRVVIVSEEGLSFISDNTNVVSNKNCSFSSKKYNYSLSLEDGNVLVNNHDTFENFLVNNISSIKTIKSISYTNKCENSIYVLLNEAGRIYYSDDNIGSLKKLKNIDQEFKMLNSKYMFNDLLIGDDNELYSSTTTGEFVKLNLR